MEMTQMKSRTEDGPAEGGPVIYLVDDEPLLLTLEEISLASPAWRIRKFEDPERALRSLSLKNPKPALLLTDYCMKGMNGLDLVARCKEIHPPLKVLLVSGTVSAEFALNAPVKVDRFLPKPFVPQQLFHAVKSLLEAECLEPVPAGGG